MDDFNTLSNRLLSRCPAVGILLAGQLINDSWHILQSRRMWSWRRRNNIIAPPALYNTGTASTNVSTGNPTLITGSGTTWTPQMVGQQIRIGGLLYPYYTIVAWISATQILIDQPWAGPDVSNQPYTILQIYYPVPPDFGYFYEVVSIKDGYKLWTNMTEDDLALLDPQRTNVGQTYAIAFRNYTPIYGGIIGPVIPVAAAGPAPVSTTQTGYTYPANATYIIQVTTGGAVGTSQFKWMRAGQAAFQPSIPTSSFGQNLSDGVQIYWPPNTYTVNDLFIINAQSTITSGGPVFELWPAPTFPGYLYPYLYIAREYDITADQPQLPPFVANRGEVLLEMALEACARYPGPDEDHKNPYYSMVAALQHASRAERLIQDMERNDEEVGVSNVSYQTYPFYPAPWLDSHWQATHAPFLRG